MLILGGWEGSFRFWNPPLCIPWEPLWSRMLGPPHRRHREGWLSVGCISVALCSCAKFSIPSFSPSLNHLQTVSEAAGLKHFLLMTNTGFLYHRHPAPAFPHMYQIETNSSQSNTCLSLVETHLGIFSSIKKALTNRFGA